jgi:hypothetical protein
MFFPSSLLFLPLDVLTLTPSSPNTYPRTYHIPCSRTYTHRGWVPRESTQEKIGCRSPEVVGGQTRSKGLPTNPRTQSPGGRDMVPPGGWGLVDNKRNTQHEKCKRPFFKRMVTEWSPGFRIRFQNPVVFTFSESGRFHSNRIFKPG